MTGDKPKPEAMFTVLGTLPKVPRAPALPRGGTNPPPDTETLGVIPPPAPKPLVERLADDVAALREDHDKLAAKVEALDSNFAGQAQGIARQIKETVAVEISDVRAHLQRQDDAAAKRDEATKERDGKVDEILGKVDEVLDHLDEQREKKLRRRISQLDLEEREAKVDDLEASADQKRADVKKAREELGLSGWTKTGKIVGVIGAIVALVATLIGLAAHSQAAHPHGAPAESEHE